MACQCRNEDPNSHLPAGTDGCEVSPAAAPQELAMQAERLQRLLTAPALFSTQASLLLMPSAGDRLLRSLTSGETGTDLVLADLEEQLDFVIPNTNKKENINGYL